MAEGRPGKVEKGQIKYINEKGAQQYQWWRKLLDFLMKFNMEEIELKDHQNKIAMAIKAQEDIFNKMNQKAGQANAV